jgi:hypothetical protein
MITATRRASLTRHHKLLQGAALTRCQAPFDGAGACQPPNRDHHDRTAACETGRHAASSYGPCVTVPVDDP